MVYHVLFQYTLKNYNKKQETAKKKKKTAEIKIGRNFVRLEEKVLKSRLTNNILALFSLQKEKLEYAHTQKNKL